MSPYLKKLHERVMSRRKFIIGASAIAAAGSVAFLRQGGPLLTPGVFPEKWWPVPDKKPAQSPVVIVKAPDYEDDLQTLILRGIDLCRVDARGKTVLLKPNLVEFSPDRPINTHPHVVLAAVRAFRARGASRVIVGEGAGHRRDTELLVEASGLGPRLRKEQVEFLDLNLDDTVAIPKVSDFMGTEELFVSKTLREADLLVSMPKLKTHHWVGATLGMKNLFGCIPGAIYGWPKNVLHWCGIEESIVDITAALRPAFTIVDGITGMEGDGPINGSAKPFGALIMGADTVAVDATCARLMGIDPQKMRYLDAAGRFLGQIDSKKIEQCGEAVQTMTKPFILPDKLQELRLDSV
jgi:uncharacterized protein (DUF362 family)